MVCKSRGTDLRSPEARWGRRALAILERQVLSIVNHRQPHISADCCCRPKPRTTPCTPLNRTSLGGICHAFPMRLSLLATVLLWIHTTESHEPGGMFHACVIVGNGVWIHTAFRTSLGGFLMHVSLLAMVLLWIHTTEGNSGKHAISERHVPNMENLLFVRPPQRKTQQ